MEEVKKGRYKHFKGHDIEVVGTALHSETLEEFVVYIHKGTDSQGRTDSLWIRPKAMFLEYVERDGKRMKRFEFVRES